MHHHHITTFTPNQCSKTSKKISKKTLHNALPPVINHLSLWQVSRRRPNRRMMRCTRSHAVAVNHIGMRHPVSIRMLHRVPDMLRMSIVRWHLLQGHARTGIGVLCIWRSGVVTGGRLSLSSDRTHEGNTSHASSVPGNVGVATRLRLLCVLLS